MIVYAISSLLILAGTALMALEAVFSVTVFQFSGVAGFGLIFVGVWLISYKVAREKTKIRRKDLGNFPGGAPGGGDGC